MLPVSRRYNQNWLPSIFNDFFDDNWVEKANATAPAINVLENEHGYELELAAPGLTKDDFKVSLDDEGDLVINMEKKEDNKEEKKRGRYLRREFSYTKFQQTMLLPDDADKEKISATVENGVLMVNIPKVEPKVVPQANKVIENKRPSIVQVPSCLRFPQPSRSVWDRMDGSCRGNAVRTRRGWGRSEDWVSG